MRDEPCNVSDLLCGVSGVCYVSEEGNPYSTDEDGDVWIDDSMEHPYWCGKCDKEFGTKEEAFDHVKPEKVAA